jgi:hypothetical protein
MIAKEKLVKLNALVYAISMAQDDYIPDNPFKDYYDDEKVIEEFNKIFEEK